MISRLEISGIHFDLDDDVRKYVAKKIGRLDQYVSRHARQSLHAEVKLGQHKVKTKKECSCEVILHLPHDTITAKETTINMFAAVDIVTAKLKNQLKRYKEKQRPIRFHRRILRRFSRNKI